MVLTNQNTSSSTNKSTGTQKFSTINKQNYNFDRLPLSNDNKWEVEFHGNLVIFYVNTKFLLFNDSSDGIIFDFETDLLECFVDEYNSCLYRVYFSDNTPATQIYTYDGILSMWVELHSHACFDEGEFFQAEKDDPHMSDYEYLKIVVVKPSGEEGNEYIYNRIILPEVDNKNAVNSPCSGKIKPGSTNFQINNKRSYSTSVKPNKVGIDVKYSDLFDELGFYLEKNKYKVSNEVQLNIEKYLSDFKLNERKPSLLHNVFSNLLGGKVVSTLKDNEELIGKYISKLLEEDNKYKTILNKVGKDYIYDVTLYTFLKILTHQNTDNTDMVSSVPVTVTLGKEIWQKFLNLEKGESQSSFSVWRKQYRSENECLFESIEKNDSFFLSLGAKITDILRFSGLIDLHLTRVSRNEKRTDFVVLNKDLIKLSKNHVVKVPPLKLPMIVPPKKYKTKSDGGYLLNDVSYTEDIFTINKQIRDSSEIIDDNKLYYLINNVTQTPFKVNKELLSFILSDKGRHILINQSDFLQYEDIKLSKYKQTKYKSLLSKFVLQEFILRIGDLYKNYNSIYYPIILDHRGRVYCKAPYFNYQSNSLAQALILFSKPGVLNKDDLENIKYMKHYGSQCFGGAVSKGSFEAKERWVDTNLENIINYDNCVLLNKAKDKPTFLAFCIEYKRFHEFLKDENLIEFHTYLPIRLDATCNGFQHLSLLSQESKLYEELNLTNKSGVPKDFYNFLVHKVLKQIREKTEDNNKVDAKSRGSYERLSNFILNRSHVKKVIMTIPYNAGVRSMIDYLKDELEEIKYDKNLKGYWYCNKDSPDNLINSNDVSLLVNIINNIIKKEFTKINKLIKYLRNVAGLFHKLNLPIYWVLPSGLEIYQSYLESKSITISPFSYSKVKLNLKVNTKDSFCYKKQLRSLMPNLIHSLDASSMTELFYLFSSKFENVQFLSIHDCFGTTTDKVEDLKKLLVYVDLYSDDHYLERFDRGIINYIKENTPYKGELFS